MTHSQAKGVRGELEAARELEALLGVKVERTAQRTGKTGCADVDGVQGLHLEIKYGLEVPKTLYKFIGQADRDCREGSTPVVLMRRVSIRPSDSGEWLALCKLDDLVYLSASVVDNWKRGLEGLNDEQ
jgi:hypothetical protein